MKKYLKLIAVLVLIALVIGGWQAYSYYSTLNEYRNGVAALAPTISPNLTTIADGVYTGSHEIVWVGATVKVTVKDHVITEIELVEHKHDRGIAAEVIPSRVVSAQSLDVDIVSGVTASSKIILQAIANALAQAGK